MKYSWSDGQWDWSTFLVANGRTSWSCNIDWFKKVSLLWAGHSHRPRCMCGDQRKWISRSTSLMNGPSCFCHALCSTLADLQFSGASCLHLPCPSRSAGALIYVHLQPAFTWIHGVKLRLGSHCKHVPLLSHLTGPHHFWPKGPKSGLTEGRLLILKTHTFYAKFILSVDLAAAVASLYEKTVIPFT